MELVLLVGCWLKSAKSVAMRSF
ncbi:Protein of unknown function [Pyronema omphalodes CBS 100304]|uniref:Uncharacterized protein n=1 Tax=Pyronema omphalodes (strain CBS 100304) TaxID=1076935 RepID=U4LAR3_PYROM|nr:Protein of unknown function [Pyronema omphalodes CBS 100304]